MKTKPKARRMWANYYKAPFNPCLHKSRRAAALGCGNACTHTVPVAVIPLDDVDGLLNVASDAYDVAWVGEGDDVNASIDCVRYALTAIGVLPKQRKGRK